MRRDIHIKINPDVLIWARVSINKTIEDIANNIGVNPVQVQKWESGKVQPTYNQLENLAYKAYKRPIAVLFRSSPPKNDNVTRDFRSINKLSFLNCSSDLFIVIKDAQYLQSKIGDVVDQNYKNRIYDFQISDSPEISAKELREYLGFNLNIQKKWPVKESLKNFKELVEQLGVFVFQWSFPIGDARGFSLYGEYPIIVINQNDSPNGRIFTLFHELYHLLLRSSNVFSDYKLGYDQELENRCNSFAAEFLVPKEDFIIIAGQKINTKWDDSSLIRLSNKYKVSKEVILRRLISLGYSTWSYYNQKRAEWLNEFLEIKTERIKRHQLDDKPFMISKAQKVLWERGKPLIRITLSSVNNGHITLDSALTILNIKAEHIGKVIQKVN